MISNYLFRLVKTNSFLKRVAARAARRLPHRKRLVNFRDCKVLVDPSELHGYWLYYEQEYDDELFSYLDSRNWEYSRALDIGANIGIWTCVLARHITKVDAFEPYKSAITALNANVNRNSLSNRVSVHECVVSGSVGHVQFKLPEKSNEGVGAIDLSTTQKFNVISVRSTSLDHFLANASHESMLIKLDVEGAEYKVWQGAVESLGSWSAPVTVVMETHKEICNYGADLKALEELVRSIGFEIRGIRKDGSLVENDLEQHRHWICLKNVKC